MKILETERLVLRRLALGDAGFILNLLNQPAFLQFIGDKGVRTVEDARAYLQNGPIASYERNGYGSYLVELKSGSIPIGICGLLKRDWLEDADVGFAFLPEFGSKGYAFESARAVLDYGRDVLGMNRIVAITSLDNTASIKLLEKLGFVFEGLIRFPDGGEEVRLFAVTRGNPGVLAAAAAAGTPG